MNEITRKLKSWRITYQTATDELDSFYAVDIRFVEPDGTGFDYNAEFASYTEAIGYVSKKIS